MIPPDFAHQSDLAAFHQVKGIFYESK